MQKRGVLVMGKSQIKTPIPTTTDNAYLFRFSTGRYTVINRT